MKKIFDFHSRFRILKGGKVSLVVSAFLSTTTIVFASPSGGNVTSGTAIIKQNGNITNINQSSQKASINWKDFSISKNETVNFNQPNKNSITLNRVVGNEKSVIDGALNANGQVWILNSNGVLFDKNAKVNTSGILATTKELSDENFQKGNYNFKGDSKATIENLGNIDSKKYASFIANSVVNNGTIKVYRGTINLIGASEFLVKLDENSNISLKVTKGVLDALVENNNLLMANAGEIYLTTNAVNELLKGVVNNTGIIEANSLDGITGLVNISSNVVINTGEIKGSSSNINIKAGFLNDSGLTDVSSDSSAAGNINIETLQMSQSKNSSIKANSANDNAGLITIKSDTNDENSSFYLSGNIEATGLNGGKVQVTANKLSLVGSTVDTSGKKNAGTINIGGNWQGQETDLDNANETKVVNSTLTNNGNNGQVVIWSDNKTVFDSIINAKDSNVEISSKEILNIDTKDILAKTLLLDPKNIEIIENEEHLNYSETDLNLTNNSGNITILKNNNVVVTNSSQTIGTALNAGIVYLLSNDGTLISTLSGTLDNDYVGNNGITALSNGNYLVRSTTWSNNKGSVTFGSGTTGVSGEISSSNSLVGTTNNDRVGNNGIRELSNGNYLVLSSSWSNSKGAVTFGSGTSGVSGEISSSNSLVGTTDNDRVGNYGITALSNGNYLVRSSSWSNNKGAVTFGSGTSGVSGEVSSSNSLVGTTDNGSVGSSYKYNDDKFYFLRDGKLVISDGNMISDFVTDDVSTSIFSNNPNSNSKINYKDIISLLEKGTTVILQANNDITLSHELLVDNINGDGGKLTFEAGRNININNNITTDNGEFIAISGSKNANSSYKDEGTPTITIADGVSINTGTAAINLVSENGRFVNNNSTTNPFDLSKVTNIYLPSFENASLGGILDYNQITASSYDVCKNGNCTIPASGVNVIKPTPTPTPTPNPGNGNGGETPTNPEPTPNEKSEKELEKVINSIDRIVNTNLPKNQEFITNSNNQITSSTQITPDISNPNVRVLSFNSRQNINIIGDGIKMPTNQTIELTNLIDKRIER
ncbi:filamentous hemagglutinin N-terminal domain-containing protein [Arcobacter lacus]|uniref:two-partner secretion domain-containing protein n=1 Tax=Arcobacter lacus TaxID=1912876 RepID=UPI0021BA85F5|nr:filamentous hemagglutinin N-terminal domain-containing protein [Arcobacter lacus]MCT7909183.1 filamentous hemagglutinin N-terminal domain-containing protein [Arcobacter lacus]